MKNSAMQLKLSGLKYYEKFEGKNRKVEKTLRVCKHIFKFERSNCSSFFFVSMPGYL